MKFNFGRYNGREIAEIAIIDPDYLDWCLTKCNFVQGKPHLKAMIQQALANRGAPPPTAPASPAAPVPQAHVAAELSRLRAENMRLAAAAADLRRLEQENERLRLENEQLEAEKVALRRAGINGTTTAKQWWATNFKRVAMLAHPDRGGSDELMKLMNELNAKFK